MTKQKVVLVTGVSSGIGKTVAEELVRQGYVVFGSVRSPESEVPSGVEKLLLDVRDNASIELAVKKILSETNRIDGLVNNAGGSLTGAVEETGTLQAETLFDVNFFGAVRVTKAVLPVMRAQRAGRIVFIGSIVGFIPTPFMAFYCASKHAIEGFSESLDHEVRTFGVRSILVEPGFMKTRIDQNSVKGGYSISEYAEFSQKAQAYAKTALENGDDPLVVAKAVLVALMTENPRLRYPVGKGAGLLKLLRRLMSEKAFDHSLRATFHLS